MKPPNPEPETSRTTGIAVAALVAIVVAAIIAAIVFGNSGIETPNTVAAETSLIPTTGTLRQVSSVVVAGEELPPLETSPTQDPAVGQNAPTITASHFDNTEVTINFDDGQPRIVMFFAHWCPHCQSEVTSLVERFGRDGTPSDVDIVAISTNVDQGAPNYPPSQWFLTEQWPIPVLRDSATNDLAEAFGLTGYPYAVVVDGDGNVVIRQSGGVSEPMWNTMLDLAVTADRSSS